MRDILPIIDRWKQQGEKIALATVVSLKGSAPRLPGAKLAVNARGEIAGSVSNGCVEPAVIEAALTVIQDQQPRLLNFGISEAENLGQIGLSCGGEIEVFVEYMNW